jgi:hypothetical protein
LFKKDEDELNDDFFLFQTVDCLKLTELPEGKIGKLKVYKSGKIELCLGNNIKLDVSLASDASFLQVSRIQLKIFINQKIFIIIKGRY